MVSFKNKKCMSPTIVFYHDPEVKELNTLLYEEKNAILTILSRWFCRKLYTDISRFKRYYDFSFSLYRKFSRTAYRTATRQVAKVGNKNELICCHGWRQQGSGCPIRMLNLFDVILLFFLQLNSFHFMGLITTNNIL